MQILRLISRGELPPRCDEPPLSDDAWSMIQSCWARQASKRPAMKDIVKWMRTTPDSDSYSLRLLLCMLKDKTVRKNLERAQVIYSQSLANQTHWLKREQNDSWSYVQIVRFK